MGFFKKSEWKKYEFPAGRGPVGRAAARVKYKEIKIGEKIKIVFIIKWWMVCFNNLRRLSFLFSFLRSVCFLDTCRALKAVIDTPSIMYSKFGFISLLRDYNFPITRRRMGEEEDLMPLFLSYRLEMDWFNLCLCHLSADIPRWFDFLSEKWHFP